MTRILAATMLALAALLYPTFAAAATFKVNLVQDLPDANPGDKICSVDLFLDPDDYAVCSLRAAIMEANETPEDEGVNVELLPGAEYVLNTPEPQPQGARAGDLDIVRPMVIGTSDGSAQRARIDANQISRAFELHEGASDTIIRGVEISGGKIAPGEKGAAIWTRASPTTFENIEVHSNTGPKHPGICALQASKSTLIVRNSHVHHNGNEDSDVAGVCASHQLLTVVASTIVNNTSDGVSVSYSTLWVHTTTVTANASSGIDADESNVIIVDSTIAANATSDWTAQLATQNLDEDGKLEVIGSIIAASQPPHEACSRLIGDDVTLKFDTSWNIYSDLSCVSDVIVDHSKHNATINLSQLADWGGTTPTMIPLPGSDAIDRAPANICSQLGVDQRGFPRPVASVQGQEARCDIGAVELKTMEDEDLPPNGIFVDGFEDV